MDDIKVIQNRLIKFRQEREWEQFHTPKDIAISLLLEAAEVLEHFQWRSQLEVEEYVKTHRSDIGEELADVFNWVLLLSNDLGINIIEAANQKIDAGAKKYPVKLDKGNHKKYTELAGKSDLSTV